MDRSDRLTARRRWGWRVAALTVLAGGLLLPTFAAFYTDWLWFAETGYRQLFLRSLTAQVVLGVGVATATFALLFTNFSLALRSLRPRQFVFPTAQGEVAVTLNQARLRTPAAVAAGFVALMFIQVLSPRSLGQERPDLRGTMALPSTPN